MKKTYKVDVYKYPQVVEVEAKSRREARKLAAEQVDFNVFKCKVQK